MVVIGVCVMPIMLVVPPWVTQADDRCTDMSPQIIHSHRSKDLHMSAVMGKDPEASVEEREEDGIEENKNSILREEKNADAQEEHHKRDDKFDASRPNGFFKESGFLYALLKFCKIG